MNIQIFGTKKCNETKKAERFFKERGIKYQFIDMKEKGMSKGEFNSVTQVKGRENMADTVYFSKIEYCEVIGYGHTTSKVLGVQA